MDITNSIPEPLVPTYLNHLKAKSLDMGGQTLAEHTWQVLARLADQYRLRPMLAKQLRDDRLWHRLFWGCFLHDFGKAAQGFQERLLDEPPENEWRHGQHRHEVLSLAFVDWLFPQDHVDRLPVICIIASHHKDHPVIFAKYGAGRRKLEQLERVNFLSSQLDTTTLALLWRWLSEFGVTWQQHHCLPILEIPTPANYASFGAGAICQALDDYSDYLIQYEDSFFEPETFLMDVHYRGLIFTADHSASAGTSQFPAMPLTMSMAELPFINRNLVPRKHQEEPRTAPAGSTILIAPTGSGKTEAALLWAARQIEQRPAARLFYTLPYQASMNAMVQRLWERYFGPQDRQVPFTDDSNQTITIQHSRALLKFYDMMTNDERTPADVKAIAKQLRNLAKLNYYPVQVFSPYQMLKAAYSLKGYEALLVDYTDALFIFDEIHAYEPKRLALIVSLIGWLATHCHARFLVMTATLPPTVRSVLQAALPNYTEIRASDEDFQLSQRHIVRMEHGSLLDNLDRVVGDYRQGQAVLVCCNQVATAQEAYTYFKVTIGIPHTDLILLHGRFNGEDRNKKEEAIQRAVGVGQPNRVPTIIVATQVVEVSLDIDLDTLYTDPAPLEALMQRFGRVNRGREPREPKTLCPVHVFRDPSNPSDSRDPYKPYQADLVQHSIEVLAANFDELPIDESQVASLLEQIYQGDIRTAWEAEFHRAADDFHKTILGKMRPYESASPDIVQDFYKLFDGVQVLPVDSENDYYDAIKKAGYLAASRYLVNIRWGQYHQCRKRGLIIPAEREEKEFVDHIKVPYDSEWGLDLAGALHMKDEAE